MDKEDPERLFEIFEDATWYDKDYIIRDITEMLEAFGYSTKDASEHASNNEYYIHYICEHGVILGHVWIYEDYDDGYQFDISDCDVNNNLNECPMCKKVKTEKVYNQEAIGNKDKIIDNKNKRILDKKTVEEIIKLIESEEYYIVDKEIIISEQEGIVLTLEEILKGKHENYGVE